MHATPGVMVYLPLCSIIRREISMNNFRAAFSSSCYPQPSTSSSDLMASRTLRQRNKDEAEAAAVTSGNSIKSKQAQKMAMARRGLKSLAVGVAVPVLATILSIYISTLGRSYRQMARPFWFPPLWAVHLSFLCNSFLMALSGWLVWAEGGFHREATIMPLYLAQLALNLLWPPMVFALSATRTGLAVCIALLLSLYGCSSSFKRVNPIAGDLVTPCLAWAAFLALLNYRLL